MSHIVRTREWVGEFETEHGANLLRLRHQPSGVEVLRTPPSFGHYRAGPQMYGIPVLFPPNRIDAGRFTYNGQPYALPINEPKRNNHIHGLCLGKPWRVLDASEQHIAFGFDHPATHGYPHDFTLELRYDFHPDAVRQSFTVYNRSGRPMPFGAGFHTAFSMTAGSTATVTASDGYWEEMRPRCLPTGRLIGWSGSCPTFHDGDDVSLHCPATTGARKGRPFRGAIITHPAHQAEIVYEVDAQFGHWCLWNEFGGQNFFCAEPMSWMVNAPNLALSPTISGLQTIPAHESWSTLCSLRVEQTGEA